MYAIIMSMLNPTHGVMAVEYVVNTNSIPDEDEFLNILEWYESIGNIVWLRELPTQS